MRRQIILSVLAFGLVAAGGVRAEDHHGHQLQCDYDSDYSVQVRQDGIMFTRDSDHDADVFMHDGHLLVNGRVVAVSGEDATRLRDYEQHVRELMPLIASIARDGVDIGYAALTTVVATLDDSGDDRTSMLQSLHDRRNEALQQVDNTLGRGTWNAGDEGQLFSDNLQNTISELVERITGNAVSDALSGDSTRLAALAARARALDTTLQKAVESPAEKLGQRADALCPRLSKLNQLQQQFQFRLPHGERLQLLSIDMDSSNKANQYAQR